MEKRILDLMDLSIDKQKIIEKYQIKDTRDWKLDESRISLAKNSLWKYSIIECAYRPFEKRWCYFGYETMDFPRRKFLDHCFQRENILLGVGRTGQAVPERPWELVTISDLPTDANIFRRGGVNAFPLYRYPPPAGRKKPKSGLFHEDDPFEGKTRLENLAPPFRKEIDAKYGKHYSPEDILGYIYAILHSPLYRAKYQEFLKIDFPRIPLVDDRETFEILSELGQELLQAHLLKMIPTEPKVEVNKGGFEVEKSAYDKKQQRLYINNDQYFSPIPKEVWEFHVGGYQVLDKYLKSRKGRTLSLDEIENIQNIVKVLAFTIAQMQKIDHSWISGPSVIPTAA